MDGSFDGSLHNRGNERNFLFQADISKVQASLQRLVYNGKGHLSVGLSPVISCSNHSDAMLCPLKCHLGYPLLIVKFKQTEVFQIKKFRYLLPEIKNPL